MSLPSSTPIPVAPVSPPGLTPRHEHSALLRSVLNYEETLARLGDDKELLAKIIEFFLEDAPVMAERLDLALAAQDANAIERSAHTLKGLAANLGATPVAGRSAEVEEAGRQANFPAARQAAAELRPALQELLAVLQSYRNGTADAV